MLNRFENPWESAAGDGALTPVGVARPAGEFEAEALMEAWRRERHESIEYRLYLDDAGRFLRLILSEDMVPKRLRRRAKSLLQGISSVHESANRTMADED